MLEPIAQVSKHLSNLIRLGRIRLGWDFISSEILGSGVVPFPLELDSAAQLHAPSSNVKIVCNATRPVNLSNQSRPQSTHDTDYLAKKGEKLTSWRGYRNVAVANVEIDLGLLS